MKFLNNPDIVLSLEKGSKRFFYNKCSSFKIKEANNEVGKPCVLSKPNII